MSVGPRTADASWIASARPPCRFHKRCGKVVEYQVVSLGPLPVTWIHLRLPMARSSCGCTDTRPGLRSRAARGPSSAGASQRRAGRRPSRSVVHRPKSEQVRSTASAVFSGLPKCRAGSRSSPMAGARRPPRRAPPETRSPVAIARAVLGICLRGCPYFLPSGNADVDGRSAARRLAWRPVTSEALLERDRPFTRHPAAR